jgi:hypothetical protein
VVTHELSIVFSYSTCSRLKTGIGRVGTLCPFPDITIHLREFPTVVTAITNTILSREGLLAMVSTYVDVLQELSIYRQAHSSFSSISFHFCLLVV